MRKPVIAGNWKMNILPGKAAELVRELWGLISDRGGVEVVVCPPFLDIPEVAEVIRREGIAIGLGAQNMHWEDSGAFTGEVSPGMLEHFDVSYVIIGHSERRLFFGETDQGVNRKVKAAVRRGMTPIMCVGESLKQREAGETRNVVADQVNRGLFEVGSEHIGKIVIAYEPIWAIGTGKAATADDAEEVISSIRGMLRDSFGDEVAERTRIQYGGSVNADNISGIMACPNIDGALVGGASLDATKFADIVRFS